MSSNLLFSQPTSISRRRLFAHSFSLLLVSATNSKPVAASHSDSFVDQSEATLDLSDDRRLDRLVTVHAEGIAMGELLPRITERTGVVLKASANVADEKVVLFGGTRPLRDVLADLAHLLGAGWRAGSGSGPDNRQWYLSRSGKAMSEESHFYEQATGGRIAGSTRRLSQGLGLDADTLAAYPDTWVRQQFANRSSNVRLAVRLLSGLSPQQCQTLSEVRRLTVPFTVLERTLQAEVSTFYHEQRAQAAAKPGMPLDTADDSNLLRYGIGFQMIEVPDGNYAPTAQSLAGEESKWPPARYRDFLSVTVGRFQVGEIDLPEQDEPWLLPPHGNPYIRGDAAKPSSLDKQHLEKALTEKTWIDRLRVLSEKTGLPIVADFYRMRSRTPVTALKESPTDAVFDGITALDKFCCPAGYLWWSRGETLFFRKRDWYLQRLYEPSDRWLYGITRALQKQGGNPTLGNMLSLGNLTTKQIAGLYGVRHVIDSSEDMTALPLLAFLELLARTDSESTRLVAKFSNVPGWDVKQVTRSYDAPTAQQRDLVRRVMSRLTPYNGPEESLGRYSIGLYWGGFENDPNSEWSPDWVSITARVELLKADPELSLSKRMRFCAVELPKVVPQDRHNKVVVKQD